MKNALIFIITCLFFNNIHAQFEPYSNFKTRHFEKNWSFSIGVNIIDDSGNQLQDFNFKEYAKDNWAFKNPFSVSAQYHFNIDFSIIGIVSFNKFKEGKFIDGWIVTDKEAAYFSFDVNGQYTFSKLLRSEIVQPYIGYGFGFTKLSDFIAFNNVVKTPKDRITTNIAAGLNVWFDKYWAFNMYAMGKLPLTKDTSQLLQYGLGIVYLIEK